jgi:hypothetical protein
MVRGLLVVLAVAFLFGAWQVRHPPAGRPAAGQSFRTDPLARAGPSATVAPELVGVRAGTDAGYDQVVFTFRGAPPDWRVAYVGSVRDAAGRPVPLRGGAFLTIAFRPARARDERGALTFDARPLRPGYPVLREVRFAGDFEGRVAFGVGVGGRGGFRVTERRDPTRVVLDLRG